MDIKPIRDPFVAALGALLIGGVSVALAQTLTPEASPWAATAEDPAGAADTHTLQEGDQTARDPNYTGTATIPVDESILIAGRPARRSSPLRESVVTWRPHSGSPALSAKMKSSSVMRRPLWVRRAAHPPELNRSGAQPVTRVLPARRKRRSIGWMSSVRGGAPNERSVRSCAARA